MMMVINQALMAGFSITQILKFISSKFPALKGGIESAEASGFDPEKILKFLSHKVPHSREGAQKQVNANDQYLSSVGIKTKEEREAARNRALSGVLGVGAGALGSYALSRAAPKILQQLTGGLGAGNATPGQPAGPQPPTTPTPGQAVAPEIQGVQAQTAQPQQPQPIAPTAPKKNAKGGLELLKNIGEEGRVANLLEGGLPPKDIAGVLRKILPKDKMAALEAIEGGIEGAIEDYAESRQSEQIESLEGAQETSTVAPPERAAKEPVNLTGAAENKSLMPEKSIETENLLPKEEAPAQLKVGDTFKTRFGETATITQINDKTFEYKTPKGIRSGPIASLKNDVAQSGKIEKGSIVASAQGVGNLKEIRNGQALVEFDGKLHKVDEKDLEPPLFSEEDIVKTYNDLMAMIPEEHKSGFIQWAGYDEDRNVLGFIPRGGKYEELKDITPQEAEKVKKGTGVARTTGETREGLWVIGEDTRGGVISQIIHDRRKKHKAEEEKQFKLPFDLAKREKEDKGMKPLFDEMAYPRNLSKEQDRQKKLEERARLKKARDEAKKRKK